MKYLSKFFALALMAGAVACNNAPEADVEASDAVEVEEKQGSATYEVSTEGDEIEWIGFKTYADRTHNGAIQVKEGKFKLEGGEIVGGKFVIDMTSVSNEDLPEEGEFNKERLINHLKSEDFFHTAEYPTATFEITEVKEAKEGNEKGATHMVSGNLTMRGNTKNITIPAMIEMDDNRIMMETPEFVIDRTQWEVEALSTSIDGLAKEQLVDNNIKLKVNLEAKKV